MRGVLPDRQVTVVGVQWFGDSALEIVEVGRPWSFDGDGRTFRLVSEAHRIRLSHLFDPVLAVHTSLIEPLPHQITAVYEEMLPRQPLRFLLADDPGAGKTIMTRLLIKELMARGDLRQCQILRASRPNNFAAQMDISGILSKCSTGCYSHIYAAMVVGEPEISTLTMPETVQYTDVYRQCSCTATQVQKYQKRISGPLLDRIDLHVEVPRLSEEELLQAVSGESSASIRERVCRARALQAQRFAQPPPDPDPAASSETPPHPADVAADKVSRSKSPRPLFCNAQMGPKEIRAYCAPSEEVKALLRAAIQQLGLSARAYDRLLKVARTIADLSGAESIQTAHVAEAIQYRSLDRKLWGA